MQKSQLSVIDSQLSGVHYIKEIYSLSLNVVQYVGNKTLYNSDRFVAENRQKISQHIKTLITLQQKDHRFQNPTFIKQLEEMKTFKMSEDQYYEFLDFINHENYAIGDSSKLLFTEDQELYFLSSLITHYMPEYLISLYITHNIIEELQDKVEVSDKKKNIFIEQNKLLYLSSQEVAGIIKRLGEYEDAKALKGYISTILEKLIVLDNHIRAIYKWERDENEINQYVNISHEIIELSHKLNDEYISLIEKNLVSKQEQLEQKIETNRFLFFVIIGFITLLMALFYRVYTSNIKKDLEIKKVNRRLDELVMFTKTDLTGVIKYVSKAVVHLSGYSKEELIGSTHAIFKHEDMDGRVYQSLWKTILDKKVWSGELLNKKKDGTPYWVYVTITPNLDEYGNIIDFSGHRVDISNQKALEEEKVKTEARTEELQLLNEQLRKLSTHDTLTQIYNRLKLDAVLETQYESYKRYKNSFSILIIDIDFFKEVNDLYGHLVGDETLKSVAKLISKNIRTVDTLGRWGGEEFMVISPQTTSQGAYKLAQKIRKSIEHYHFHIVGQKTVSIGVAECRDALLIGELVKSADDALYEAKKQGRNRCIIGQ